MIPPEVSNAWLWTGSEFAPANGIPVTDRGFRYGMSVFESFPVRNGVVPFLENHLTRLRQACAQTAFSIPPHALDACGPLLKHAGDGFGRIYVTAGDGPVTGAFTQCRSLILVEPRQPPSGGTYHRGYNLALHPGSHVPLFPGLKTANYWPNLRAFREGVATQCNETLLFTPEGLLISACMANAFVVKNGHIKTPALGTGARPGVIREWAMSQIQATESLMTRAEVESADEIFLTSSWLGIMPAASVGNRPLPDRQTSTHLRSAYRIEVERA
jgi:branched-subunit amino acid aminotransferase/4-amino-4-deoxychorismate lyase